jgi:hypothetical protein
VTQDLFAVVSGIDITMNHYKKCHNCGVQFEDGEGFYEIQAKDIEYDHDELSFFIEPTAPPISLCSDCISIPC